MKTFGIVGWKNAGKTRLVVRLVEHFCGRGLRVSTVKHAHHAFDIDRPGKDSHLHREAGAAEVLVASASRFALIHEHRGAPEPGLAALLARLAPVDLVLVEGFKRDPHPKIEVCRESSPRPLIAESDPSVLAVAAEGEVSIDRPVLPLSDIAAIADFILEHAR